MELPAQQNSNKADKKEPRRGRVRAGAERPTNDGVGAMNHAKSCRCLLFIVLAASVALIQVNVVKEATRDTVEGEHDVRSNHSKPETLRDDSPVCNPHWKVAIPQYINNDTSLPVHRYM